MKEWFTAAEIASFNLPSLPRDRRNVFEKAQRESWVSRPREGRGGGREYHLSVLPPDAAARLLIKLSPAPQLPAQTEQSTVALTDPQRRRMEARLALLAELDRIAEAAGLNQAIKAMIGLAASGSLPDHLQSLVPLANARAGDERTLSRRSLLRWREERKRGASSLAPKSAPPPPAPAWGSALLAAFARPQKPSLRAALAALDLASGQSAPSYHQARRFLARVSVIDRNRGRMGPRELKSLRSFTRRDVAQLQPLDVALMDGHGFDAEVAHPHHGKPFRPEITSIIDARTRKVTGWSVALAESQHAVMDALRHATTTHGVIAILYVDRGSGYEGEIISAPVIGLLARLGTRHETSLPYNSQARGMIERLHQTLWVAAARELPTFMGDDMDKEARKKVYKLTRAQIEQRSRSPLMPWRDFCDFVEHRVALYNDRPHRALAGKSPNQAWADALEAGFAPVQISKAEADDLFRPTREGTTRRGEVVLFGNIYFNRALEHRTGERVVIAYDIHDVSRVWVKDLDGRLLCEAALDGNKRDFFPKSVVDQARESRVKGKLRRLEAHAETARAELGPRIIDAEAEDVPQHLVALADEQMAKLAPPPANDEQRLGPDGHPAFPTDEAFGRWCLANPALMTEHDAKYFAELMREWSFRFLIGVESDEEQQSQA